MFFGDEGFHDGATISVILDLVGGIRKLVRAHPVYEEPD